jgi:hypothetical protein
MSSQRKLWGFVIVLFTVGCSSQAIAWVSPVENTNVWGIVRLQVQVKGASDVNFYIDEISEEGYLGAGNSAEDAHFEADWYTQDFPNGEYTIYAVVGEISSAVDDLQNQAALTVIVNNRMREATIPVDVIKMTPQNDPAPPRLEPGFKAFWYDPVPLGPTINSAGAEDAPFITPDGQNLYFWFTGDPSVDVQDQAKDPLTGIYVTHKENNAWEQPERLYLQYFDQLALDGAHTIWNDTMWFASVREGNFNGMDMWSARHVDGKWTAWRNLGEKINRDYQIGEMHISADGSELYFDSKRPGGMGGKDIWVSYLVDGEWGQPQPISAVNSELDEGWPFITQDMSELWFTGTYGGPAIFRSLKVNGVWGTPELVLSPMAGEPSLDAAGNLYFVHHRWDEVQQRVSEADIYVCYRID